MFDSLVVIRLSVKLIVRDLLKSLKALQRCEEKISTSVIAQNISENDVRNEKNVKLYTNILAHVPKPVIISSFMCS